MNLKDSAWRKLKQVNEDGSVQIEYVLVIGKRAYACVLGKKCNASRHMLWGVHILPWVDAPKIEHPVFTSNHAAKAYVDSFLRKAGQD